MTTKHILIFIAVLSGFCFIGKAEVREIDVTITQTGQDLQANVSGTFGLGGANFCFPENITLFPVPPDANNIDVSSVPWTWSVEIYQTLYLPEEPNWPMIQWELVYFTGPYYPFTVWYSFHYEHILIKREGKFIFFYSNESLGTYWFLYGPHGLFYAEDFTVHFPSTYSIEGVWSRDIPIPYQVNATNLTFSVDSEHIDRITIILRGPCEHVLEGDLNDDCVVDFKDLAVMGSNWLIDCIEDPDNPACLPKM